MADAVLASAGTEVRRAKPLGASYRRLITMIILAVVCATWIYPLLWMVSASLKSNGEIFAVGGLIPQAPTFENYVRAWEKANIGRYFFNSLFVTAGSVVITTVSSALMGYVLGRRSFPGRRVVFGILIATLFLPTGYTIIPVYQLLTAMGLGQSLWGLMLATCGYSIVIFVLLFAGYFSQLPKELDEATRMDGVGPFKTFLFVMLPLSKPVIVTVVVMQTLNAWNDFLLPLVITLPDSSLRTLSVGVYAFRGENYVDWGGMMASSSITIVPVVLLFLFLQRYFIDGLAGAVKG